MAMQSDPWSPGDAVNVTGLGVRLRSLSPADIDDAFVAQLRDPAVSAQLAMGRNPGAITIGNMRKFLANFDNRRSFFLGIYPAGGPGRLGFCWAKIDAADAALITLAITRRDQWGRGAASAAGYVLREFLFARVGAHKMVARAYEENAAILHVMKRNGWVQEGLLREAEPDGKGGWRSIALYGLLRDEHAAGPVPPHYAPPAQ